MMIRINNTGIDNFQPLVQKHIDNMTEGTIQFDPGTYYFAKPIIADKHNLIIEGNGATYFNGMPTIICGFKQAPSGKILPTSTFTQHPLGKTALKLDNQGIFIPWSKATYHGNWWKDITSVTIDMWYSRHNTTTDESFKLVGLDDRESIPSPWILTWSRIHQGYVLLWKDDKQSTEVLIAPNTGTVLNTIYKVTAQIDLPNGIAAIFVDNILVAKKEFEPNRKFLGNFDAHIGINTRFGQANLISPGSSITLYGLNIVGKNEYTVGNIGAEQSRTDGQSITDQLTYFTYDTRPEHLLQLSLLDSYDKNRVITVLCGGSPHFGLITCPEHADIYNSIIDTTIQNLNITNSYGTGCNILLGFSLQHKINNIISHGACAVGTLRFGANYITNINNMRIASAKVGFSGWMSTLWANNIHFDKGVEDCVRLFSSSLNISKTFGSSNPYTNKHIHLRGADDLSRLIVNDWWMNNETHDTPLEAGIQIDGGPGRIEVDLQNVLFEKLGPNVPELIINDHYEQVCLTTKNCRGKNGKFRLKSNSFVL